MTILISIAASALALIFAALFFLFKRDVRLMSEDLSRINSEKTNSRITTGSRNIFVIRLAKEINDCICKNNEKEASFVRADSELRNAIADMSHDLRTPLTSIMGYLQLVKDESIDEGEREEYLNIVEKRAKSLQNLICSFYDLSRLQAGEYKFELMSVNMHNMLSDIVASFYNDFVKRRIEPAIELDMNVPKVIGDENAISRIFANLIQNGLKYAKSHIRISQTVEGNCLCTVFTNDTDELDEKSADKIFDRFFTADRMRTGQNTGLGLAITKELTKQMGHSISSEYSEGELSITVKWKISELMKN